MAKHGRLGQATCDNIIWRMSLACCITKAIDTHSEYVVLLSFLRERWLRERASSLRLYVNTLPALFTISLSFISTTVLQSSVIYGHCAAKLIKLINCVLWEVQTDFSVCLRRTVQT